MNLLTALFSTVLRMSLTGCFVIAVVLVARLCLKRAPRIFSYCLWAVVLFRLCCPISFESAFSLIPSLPAQRSISAVAPTPSAIDPPTIPPATSPSAPVKAPTSEPADLPAVAQANPTPLEILSLIWLSGAGIFLAGGLASSLRLRQKLKGARQREGNLYEAAGFSTPFVFGLIRPKIYLPSGLSPEEERYILLHEQTHIRRRDYLAKALAFLVLCLHWFNPLCWLAFQLMSADMEMSCDERVIRELGSEIKREYSASLLSLAAGRRLWPTGPLAFGEGGVKARIQNVLRCRRPALWILLLAVAAVAALILGLAANPRREIREDEQQALNAATTLDIIRTVEGDETIVASALSDQQLLEQLRPLLLQGEKASRSPVNDTPDAAQWLTFTLTSAEESMTYYLYEQDGNYYLEKPYDFIRIVDSNVYQSLTALAEATGRNMTMDDVRTLAQKGEALAWSDLEGFFCSDVGSGLYILRYPLTETGWALMAGSDAPQGAFRYVNLVSPLGAAMDIRTGDLEDFLSQQNNAFYPERTVFSADLTHDGTPESVVCDFTGLEDGNGSVEISVRSADDVLLWSDTISTSHVGWVAYYLCTLEGEDYLIRYFPYANQGAAEYSYQIFWLDGSGSQQILQENSIFFALSAGPHGLRFEPEEIAQFVQETNLYLSQGYLLCSTLEGNVTFSREEMKATQLEYLDWLGNSLYTANVVIDRQASLLDQLKAYQEKVLEPQFETYGREVFCDMLHQSITYENGELSLTIPERYFPDTFTLQVSVRPLPGSGMSWHAFEEESSNGSWLPGKTYSVPIDPATVDTLIIDIGVPMPDGSTLTRTVTLVPDGNGFTQDFEDETLPGDTATISGSQLPISLRAISYHISRYLPADVTGDFPLAFTSQVVKWNGQLAASDVLEPPKEAQRVAGGALLELDFGGFIPDSITVEREVDGVRTAVTSQPNDYILLQALEDETAIYWITARWDNGNEVLIAIHVAFV